VSVYVKSAIAVLFFVVYSRDSTHCRSFDKSLMAVKIERKAMRLVVGCTLSKI
jgi:hypothetical protein